MFDKYSAQVALLVKVLPYVAKENCFALKGGTAINLFMRNLPRLSVDIDLTYIPIEDRIKSIDNINAALKRIKISLNQAGINANLQQNEHEYSKLNCYIEGASIKIEPNYIMRGAVFPVAKMKVCKEVEDKYGFAAIQVINKAELYGGKICAALDRQHPRDLFDIKYLLDSEGIDSAIKQGFLLMLLSHNRPVYELLNPNFQEKEQEYLLEFQGMTEVEFTYEDHQETFNRLIKAVLSSLDFKDKEFLTGFHNLNPNWNLLPELETAKNLPAIKWKLQNLQKLKEQNIEKYNSELKKIKELF